MKCRICPHHCELSIGQTGRCRARRNIDGNIVPLNYGRVTSIALDPIEKKPLMRFYPGEFILSVCGFCCNLSCPFCQNHEISMAGEEFPTRPLPPEQLAEIAKELAREPRGNLGVAFTYNEPFISFEYVMDTAKLLKPLGLHTVLVTNGTVEQEPLKELLPWISAMNIDLKGFRQEYYDWLGGNLETVKNTIRLSSESVHVEVTTLIVPGENDGPEEMEKEAEWLAGISPDIPLHISRFFPRHHVQNRPPTPVERIHQLCRVAGKYLKYVYPGNC
ncbi:MAG: AmmeMemoRadiSam system radical SAM enzyme [Selenomonadaceae bacterium]|nr:AmmeMemoRadiSam system radical SAM enzyme [Selenomonadaceae bacterium]